MAVPTVAMSLSMTFWMAYFEITAGTNQAFSSASGVIWWWVVTVSTVGYGDVIPETVPGRLLGALVILSSMVIFAIVIGEFTSLLRSIHNYRDKGLAQVKEFGHVVIVGYNSIADKLVIFLRERYGQDLPIVFVSSDMNENPFKEKGVLFVRGDPMSDAVMYQANITHAKVAFVLLNERLHSPDAYSVMIGAEIERLQPDVLTVAEVSDQEKAKLYRFADVDFILLETEMIRDLLSGIDPPDYVMKPLDDTLRAD